MHLSRFFALALLTGSTLTQAATDNKQQIEQIQQVISRTYDQPNLKVRTTPVVVANEYAIADWVQGAKGGRALLKRNQQQWEIMLCAGDSIKQADGLIAAGVNPETAKQLQSQLEQAEKTLPAAVRKQLRSFEAQPASSHGHGSHH